MASKGGANYTYDANGNMQTRPVNGQTHTLGYDAEGHLVTVTHSPDPAYSAAFSYDGDGKRVKSTINSVSTIFVGNYYEKTGSTITKYHYAGATRIGMRKYTIPQSMVVEYFLGDHLGSTSITTDNGGARVSEMRYKPFGEVRYTWKDATLTQTTPAYALTKWTFTGQFSYADDPSTPGVEDFGLIYFNARFYDPMLGRFSSPDTLIPGAGDPQAWDRYAFVFNNPLNYTDPSGHWPDWLAYTLGAVTQYFDDVSLGLFYKGTGDPTTINNAAFQDGRNLGRSISATQAMVETVVGVAMIEVAASTTGPALGGIAGCAVITEGACGALAIPVVVGEAAAGLEGMIMAGHGGAMLAKAGRGDSSAERNWRQDTRLSEQEIELLKGAGYDIHELKGGKGASKYDLYRDAYGNVYVKPVGGKGAGEDLRINLNDLPEPE